MSILVFLIALILRAGYSYWMQHAYFFYATPGEDVMYYKNWAQAVVFGDGISHHIFSGMPLFPYYLAVLFRLTGGHWEVIAFFNLILGALNCVLVYSLAKKIFSNRAAALAGLLTATNFILIYYDWLMMPITLLITLTLVILIALRAPGPITQRQWFILGITIGLATLGDGKFLIFAVLLIFYLLLKKRTFLPAAFPLLLGLLLILGGVTVRNKIVGGEWIFISSQSGLSFYVGNNAQATGNYENPEFIRPSHEGQDTDQRIYVEQHLGRKATLTEVSHYYRQQAMSFITTQPGEYLKLLRKKLSLLISDHEYTQAIDLILQRDYKHKLDWNSYSLIFPLAMIGFAVAYKKRKDVLALGLLIAAQFIFSLIYFVTTRHRASILPLFIILEAFALSWLVEKIFLRQFKPLLGVIVLILLYTFCFPSKFLDAKTYAFLTFSKSGSVYDGQKDYKKASEAYLAALKLQPHDTNSLYNLATAYVNLKDYARAEQLYLSALAVTDFNVDVLFNLGYVYEQKGETDKAIASYQKVLDNAPASLDAHFRMANLYQNRGQCIQAKHHYDEIIRQNPILKTQIDTLFSACH